MPEIFRDSGLRFVIFPDDHDPAHVHVLGQGWEMKIDLMSIGLRAVKGKATRQDSRKALELVHEHRASLLEAWENIHG